MDSYGCFARFYDYLNQETDYSERAEYLVSLFERFDKKPELLLDLGCGTGSLMVELLKKGIDIIGVDGSPEMLSVAREKFYECKNPPLLLCQMLDKLDLYGTVDGCVSTLDTLNHITDLSVLEDVFKRLYLFIRSGGLLIFDLNTEFKHRKILKDNTFVYDTEKVYFVWQNIPYEDKTDIYLDMFVPDKYGKYTRYTESFSERVYSEEQISNLAEKCGFEILQIYNDLSYEPPLDNSEKITYILKRKG